MRASDVVDARVACVLRDRAGIRVGRQQVAPVDRRGEVARGKARRPRDDSGRRGERAHDRIDVPEALDGVDRYRRARRDHDWRRADDVDVLVVDRIDDACAGDADEHFTGKQARRDGWGFAASVVVQRVGPGAAVQEQHGAVRHAQTCDIGDVLVAAAVQGSDHARRRVEERDVIVTAGGRVESESRQPG